MAKGKKCGMKKWPKIFSAAARLNPFTYNNKKNNFSLIQNFCGNFFYAYLIIIELSLWINFIGIYRKQTANTF